MSGSTWLRQRGSAAQAPPACRPPLPRPRCSRRGPRVPPGSAGGRRTKSGAGGCPAEQQKVVPTTPAPMLFDVASRPPRGGLQRPAGQRIPLECAAGRPIPSNSPLLAPQVSGSLQAEAGRAPPTFFHTCQRGGAQGGGSAARRDTLAAHPGDGRLVSLRRCVRGRG